MLGKLLKYDLKWIYKNLVIFYSLALIFAVIGKGLSFIDNSAAFYFLSKFSYGVSTSLLFSILINNLMRIWARVVQNVYKDEAYLTHTLPVTKKEIYLSKLFSTVITLFTSTVMIIICLMICYYGDGLIEFLKLYITDSFRSIIVYAVVVLFLEILFILVLGILAIIIGYSFNHGKLIKSLVCGFGIYMFSSVFSLLVLVIVGIFNSNVMELFTSSDVVLSGDILRFILFIAVVLYTLYIVVICFISNKLLNRGVNID